MSAHGYKVEKEEKDHFMVRDGHGSFKVAKKGLNKSTLAKIQKFAEGGDVFNDRKYRMASLVAGEDEAGTKSGEKPPQQPPQPDLWTQIKNYLSPPKPEPKVQKMQEGGEAEAQRNLVEAMPQNQNASPDVPDLPERPHAEGPPTPTPAELEEAQPPAAEKAAMTQKVGPRGPDELAKAAAAAEEAIRKKGQVESQAQLLAATQQQENNKEMAALIAQHQQQYAENEKLENAAFEDYKNGRVDPNRLWHETSTAGKISAAIGLIAGGVGAGLTGGHNQALQIMDNAINRDIESQKIDLNKKSTIVGHYMQKGHDIQTATQLAVAKEKDMAAGKMLAMAYQSGSQQAIATAEQMATQQHVDAVNMRQMAASRGMDMALKGMQLLQVQQSYTMGQMQLGAMGEFMKSQSTNSGGGTKLDPRVIPFLPKDFQERLVSLPDGTHAMAPDKEEANKVRDSQGAINTLRDKLARYNALLQQHPHGISRFMSPNDYDLGESIHASMITDLNKLADLSRLNEREVELFQKRIPDIRNFQVFGGHQAKLGELGKEIDDKVWETNQSKLNLPRKRRFGG